MKTRIKNKKRGDRPDGHYVKAPGLQTVMGYLFPKRTDCEVYLNDKIDATELIKYIEKKNAEHPEYKTTIFHCALFSIARIIKERPLLNRFIQGYRMYEREEISLSFVAKRRFADGANESLLFLVPKDDDTIDSFSREIVGDVTETRKSEVATGGVDELLDKFAAMPRFMIMSLIRIIRWLDFWGINPEFITEGDPNYSTVLASNLGSIKCPSVYHHLNNYGTNSIMVTIGTLHKEEVLMPDGHKEIRDVIDFGAILDERIADGFYFAKSLRLLRHIFENPELLDKPLGEPSGFDYDQN